MVSQLLWVVMFVIATQWVDISDGNGWMEGDIPLHSTPSGEESKTYHPNPNDRDQIKLWKDGLVPYMFSHSNNGKKIDEILLKKKRKSFADLLRRFLIMFHASSLSKRWKLSSVKISLISGKYQ